MERVAGALARDERVTKILSPPPLAGGGRGEGCGQPRLLIAHPSPRPPPAREAEYVASALWVTAERLPQFLALWPDAQLDPAITPPAAYATRAWSRDDAMLEILRGRLEGQGPVTVAALAAPLGLEPDDIATALTALEVEGFAMRGRFTPGRNDDEWCERRLLARIHRYTVKRLRAEIEPVAARDFLRFLFAWQRVTDDARMDGPMPSLSS